MQSSSEQPLVGEERYVTTRITAAKETTCLPDHRELDSDQQYPFAKVHALCNYHKAEAIIVFYFAKPNVALQRPFFGQFGV